MSSSKIARSGTSKGIPVRSASLSGPTPTTRSSTLPTSAFGPNLDSTTFPFMYSEQALHDSILVKSSSRLTAQRGCKTRSGHKRA